MNGARFVHDQLELAGFKVAIADAHKVKGLAPLACTTDRIDAWVLPRAVPPRPGPRDLAAHPRGAGRTRTGTVPAAPSPPPDRAQAPHPRHPAGLRQALARSATSFGAGGRQLLARLVLPEPWIGNLAAALALIDDLDDQIDGCERERRRLGADHP
jgi:transposase